jgi:uncharacterized repeat protein (TIGR03803 family)
MNRFAAALALCAVFILPVHAASAATYTVVHTFTANEHILGGLTMDNKGNMWGTTDNGGANSAGTIFEITAKGVYSVVHTFGAAGDGAHPQANMIADKQHNLWGTTTYGGARGVGTIFEITAGGSYSMAYSFCSVYQSNNCLDGSTPTAPLFLDNKGALVGTTDFGGTGVNCSGECGIVFKFAPAGGIFTTLHNFTHDGVDGIDPLGGVVQDKKHNYWGTTYNDGSTTATCDGGNCGVVFEITAKGVYSVAHNLCNDRCADGYGPYAGLFKDKAGNLWGTTALSWDGAGSAGTIFKIATNGAFSVVKNFECDNVCDGQFPRDTLIEDKLGNMWGTTAGGGTHAHGIVFTIAPDNTFTDVYDFCSQANCADGSSPTTGLTLGKKGTIWGTTDGGSGMPATIFKITP